MKTRPPQVAPTDFAGFTAGAFKFLRELADNQTRDWFLAHKSEYEAQVREPMASLVTDLSRELLRRSIPLQGDPKRSIFRINRDIRFSNDKSPYKTHVGAVLTRDGEKMSPGLLYIHVQPEDSFAAAGFYQPEANALRAIRNRIASSKDDIRRVLTELGNRGTALLPDEDALKRVPRGFESVQEADLADILRRNSLIVRRPLPQKLLKSSALVDALAEFAETSAPLLNFGWKAIASAQTQSKRR